MKSSLVWKVAGSLLSRVARFTEDLKAYLQAPHVLPLASATAGLQLALEGIGLQPVMK